MFPRYIRLSYSHVQKELILAESFACFIKKQLFFFQKQISRYQFHPRFNA